MYPPSLLSASSKTLSINDLRKFIDESNWTDTPLGPIENWPQSLLTTVSLIMESPFPFVFFWGPELVMLYNNGYIPIAGAGHPEKFGKKGADAWPEAWHILFPLIEKIRQQEPTSVIENQQFFLTRNNYLEECYFTFSFSPIYGEDKTIAGIITPAIETTAQVLSERRMRILQELGLKSLYAKSEKEVAFIVEQTLLPYAADIPFALLYLTDTTQGIAKLSALTRLASHHPAALAEISLADNAVPSCWQITEALQSKKAIEISLQSDLFGDFPGGAWPESPRVAVVLPLLLNEEDPPAGVLILGINPRRVLDPDYFAFIELAGRQISTALMSVRAYEEQQHRAEILTALDQTKTAFFNNVSHEFRTPLALILSPAEMALADSQAPLPATQRERVLLIQRNANRMLKLVNSLLDFSQIEAGKIQKNYTPIDLASFTKDIASMFQSMIEAEGLLFEVDIPPLEERVYIDTSMWEKIVLNLLSNAFKFTLQGRISLALQKQDNQIMLTVSDTGRGIAPNAMPHLFERFYRIEGGPARSHEGTGIGLALLHELVKLHGGKVDVSSELEQGSIFRVYIPLGKKHLPTENIHETSNTALVNNLRTAIVEEASRWATKKSAGKIISKGSFFSYPPLRRHLSQEQYTFSEKKPRLLIVDDNHDMREVLSDLFQEKYEVEVVNNGEEALDAVAKNRPALILTDLMMPKTSGIQLIKTLRQQSSTQTIPIIILSGRAGEEDKTDGFVTGADDYIIKPFFARELLARVNVHVELGQLRDHLEATIKKRTDELNEANTTMIKALTDAATQQRLRAEEAEKFQKKQTEFIGTVCHEIRNPLHGIKGSVDLLKDTLKNALQLLEQTPETNTVDSALKLKKMLKDISSFAHSIEECANYQTVITEDVLHLNRLEENKLTLASIIFSPSDIIQSIAAMFKDAVEHKNIQLQILLPSTPVLVKGDPHRLKKIIINLVTNAINFTFQGTITLTLKVVQTSAAETLLDVCISDTGIGMSDKETQSLFAPYAPVGSQGYQQFGGSGLSLSISKRLIELMHGRLEVNSTKGVGSTFSFTIHCAALTEEEIVIFNSKKNPQKNLITATTEKKPLTVWIVEDNILNQKLLLKQLSMIGFICLVANNGKEAVERYLDQTVDVILMDVEMPELNGLEATRQIRQKEKDNFLFSVPIIGVSANAQDHNKAEGLASGMDDYLTKPVIKELLVEKIYYWHQKKYAPFANKDLPGSPPQRYGEQNSI